MWSWFCRSEDGTVSTEFVLIAPLFASLVGLVVSTSSLYATATELQQISFELARMSVRYAEPGRPISAICSDLLADHSASASNLGNLISADRIDDIGCTGDESSRLLEVSITYDMTDQLGAGTAKMLGVDVGSMTRVARLHI